MEINQRYNKLTAIEFHHRDKYSNQFWIFLCECGKKKIIRASYVKTNRTKSCGCIKSEAKTTHGMTGTKIYECWTNMKTRCLNKNCKEFKYYGGRGITVCKRWMNSFQNFYNDMGNMPEDKTIDREDNDGNYTPKNCRYATMKEQCSNKRHKGFAC